ncbi:MULTISPECIES: hypothetical protein [unclassified Xanthomonas]|uniref:hypothetical protein n=1 Tax=unclassified Xanthomonas TaxID=2643310 RepID=UPI0028830A1A|nr:MULTISPECIES: hypothetical protein [unclassified Xanthomonas]
MSVSDEKKAELLAAFEKLTPAQQARVMRTATALGGQKQFWRNESSDIVTETVLNALGDRLVDHHSGSNQALSKDRFEHAFESALNEAGTPAELVKSRTNRGHDMSVRDVPVNLKTEAAAGIKEDLIHVSKWMELGKGEWDIEFQRRQFLGHLANYERILTLRRLKAPEGAHSYELVEIPKALLLESATAPIELAASTSQTSTPGYVRVRDKEYNLKFALYFDAGSERKLQVKHLKKSLCHVHATWKFGNGVGETS